MITKVICPTDFSGPANNAVQYAAKLAQAFNAELLLLNVEPFRPKMGAAITAGVVDEEEKEMLDNKLKQLKSTAEIVQQTFHVKCEVELEVSTESMAKAIAHTATGNSIIVMGSNGADNLYQFYFGSNTYHVIQEAKCPVILVPEKSTFVDYKNIAYALTYEEKGRLAIDSLIEFGRSFEDANFNFLHVSKNDTNISQDLYRINKEEAETIAAGKITPTFSRVYAEKVSDGIEKYLNENPTDLLVVAAHHRTFFESIFSPKPVLDSLSAVPPCPILVFQV